MIPSAEIRWLITDRCNYNCEYCPSKYRSDVLKRNVEEYIDIVKKLQNSRYKYAKSIKWRIGGGEPLSFGGIVTLLREIKKQPATVRLETSGGDTWFNFVEVSDLVDSVKLTHHYWQNISVLEFLIDLCQQHNKPIDIVIPLNPGRIREDRELVEKLNQQGIKAQEQTLQNEDGKPWIGYSKRDVNIIMGRPEDYEESEEPVNNYVDLSKPPADDSPSFLGQTCYAGVDYLFINERGFVIASECGGRNSGNIFNEGWEPPDNPFKCPMYYCRSTEDRRLIRMGD